MSAEPMDCITERMRVEAHPFLHMSEKDTRAPGYRGHPSRPHLTGVERENPDGVRTSGKPTARKAELSSGKRWPKKRMLAAERQREIITGQIGQMLNLKGC